MCKINNESSGNLEERHIILRDIGLLAPESPGLELGMCALSLRDKEELHWAGSSGGSEKKVKGQMVESF